MASKKKVVPRRKPSEGAKGKKFRRLRIGQIIKIEDRALDKRLKLEGPDYGIPAYCVGSKVEPTDGNYYYREVVKRRGK
jgi:hypothetical protein